MSRDRGNRLDQLARPLLLLEVPAALVQGRRGWRRAGWPLTSDDRLRPARRAGVFRFQLAGEDHALSAYAFAEVPDDESLFVPFLDATSGHETYGAGRYLDLEPEEDGNWSLDFNLAYHPSCVYDPRYSCPLTPPENRLPVPIEAGERLPPSSSA